MATTAEKDITFFAKTNFRNAERMFGIKSRDRRQHMYVIGKTGTGKTTLISNMVIQDIVNGKGVCVVDPHGELVETILKKIPKERVNDVIYFNPADSEHPMGFNVLEVSDPKYKHLVSSDLMGIFTKIWANVWSARMEYILNNCVLALLDTPGTTLLGITRILVDKDYRQKIIANIKDPVVKSFWIHEYETWRDQFRNEAIVPIQNKVGQFLSTSLIRNIVGQPKSTINIQKIMNDEKILLVNVSKGRIGEDNSALLGAMFITKIQLAAMERVRISEEERKDFYLYVDEFQNFATDSFANILSEARKYRLNLIIAHQYIGQLLTEKSTKVRDAVFGNTGTMITFRVGAADAEFLEKEFEPEFTIQDIVNIPNHQIYLKLMVDGVTSRPFSAAILPPFSINSHEDHSETVIQFSRKNYSNPRKEVENEIARWSGFAPEKTAGPAEYDKEKPRFIKKERVEKIRYAENLGDIGIEFEPREKKFSMAQTMKETPAEEKPAQKYLSLKELPREETPKKEELKIEAKQETAKKPNIEELKDALKKILGTG
ncbi:MAG: type IV secretion system DNA-binding domain-containing protein [Patescibacteria group bacterium]